MPLLKIQTSVIVPEGKRAQLLADASRIVAETTGKPEKYVMVVLQSGEILMGGAAGAAAFMDVRGIGGLNKAVDAFEDSVVDAGEEPAEDALLMATDGFGDVDDSRNAAVGGPEVPLVEE